MEYLKNFQLFFGDETLGPRVKALTPGVTWLQRTSANPVFQVVSRGKTLSPIPVPSSIPLPIPSSASPLTPISIPSPNLNPAQEAVLKSAIVKPDPSVNNDTIQSWLSIHAIVPVATILDQWTQKIREPTWAAMGVKVMHTAGAECKSKNEGDENRFTIYFQVPKVRFGVFWLLVLDLVQEWKKLKWVKECAVFV